MGRTRTFIAVDVGDDIRNSAVALQETLARSGAKVKWVGHESLHITLLFLGEVDDRALHSVCRTVREVASGEPPFPVRVSGVGAFPNPRRPKVVWAGIVEGLENLLRLHENLEARMSELGGYRKEVRDYTPHLTLGRVVGESDGLMLASELTKRLAWDGGRTMVDEVLLFGSVLQREGPEYTVLGRGELKGPPRPLG